MCAPSFARMPNSLILAVAPDCRIAGKALPWLETLVAAGAVLLLALVVQFVLAGSAGYR
jgi:hypothetical protein